MINGFVEGAEYLGIKIDPDNKEYQEYGKLILQTIEDLNKKHRTKHERFNLEFVPSLN